MDYDISHVILHTESCKIRYSVGGTPNIFKDYNLSKGFYFYVLNPFLSKPQDPSFMLILVMKYSHKNLSNGISYMVIEFVLISLGIMGNRFGA